MKKILFAILTILTITLTACSTSSTGMLADSTSNDLPAVTHLAVGTLKLSGTEQAVTPEQAKDLIVYWETYKQLAQSDTAAQKEIDGLVAQIQETMTDEQMKAIDDMNITQQDVVASMQGVTVTVRNASDSAVSVSSGGSMPAGGPPADGGGAPPDSGMGADMGGAAPGAGIDQTQNLQASTSAGTAAGLPTELIEAVIQSLQKIPAA